MARNPHTWQNRLPPELRRAGINTVEEANAFLRERYITECNGKFSQPAAEKGTVFRQRRRSDLDRVFSMQTERVVAKDNTVTIQDRCWQLHKSRFRHTLAGCTVTVCEHLDGRVSIQGGPPVLETRELEQGGGKDGACGTLEISSKARDSHFAHRPTTATRIRKPKTRSKVA